MDTDSHAKGITSFRFEAADNPVLLSDAEGTISGSDIVIVLPYGTMVTSLKASFTASGETVTHGGFTHISGASANDFTEPVTYTATAIDGTTQDYTVTINFQVSVTISRSIGNMTVTNNGESFSMTGNGTVLFTSHFGHGDPYNIQIESQPADQTCTVANGSGTVSDTGIRPASIACSTISIKTEYTGADLTSSAVDPSYDDTGLTPVSMTLGAESNVLITLSSNIGHTNGCLTRTAFLRLLVNGSPVARARESHCWGNVVSANLITIQKLSAGTHTISTDFSIDDSTSSTQARIYGVDASIITATVLETLPGYLGSSSASLSSGVATSGVTSFTEFGMAPLSNTMSSAGTLLLGLSMAESSIDTTGSSIMGGIELNGTMEAEGRATGDANNWLPLSFFTATPVLAGTHDIRAKWMSSNGGATITLADTYPTHLTAVALDNTVYSQTRYYTGGDISTTNTTYQDLPDLASINITLETESRVFISFLAGNTWGTTGAGGQGMFGVDIDGSTIAESRTVSPNSARRRPVMINTIETLSAGSHTVKILWKSVSVGVNVGTGTKSTQLSVTVID